MNKEELEQRTKKFAMQIIKYISSLPKGTVPHVLGSQLLRSGTSIGANYREANRAESRKDFIHKIGIVEKEASETQYWLDLMIEAGVGNNNDCKLLLGEASELLAIFTATGKSCKRNKEIK